MAQQATSVAVVFGDTNDTPICMLISENVFFIFFFNRQEERKTTFYATTDLVMAVY